MGYTHRVTNELPKAYQPNETERAIAARWERSGFFNPDTLPPRHKVPFSIALPPPNTTGIMHIGHAVMLALQDIIIRFERMRGKKTLWLPGTDHAAIATQNVVEKELKAEGKTRHDLGREQFLARVDQFVENSQGTIRKQIEAMGASLDWSRERFTLDKGMTAAVNEAFVRLYDDGLIYRGTRVVNWCPRCQSTLADDEVEYKEQNTILYTFPYDKQFPISISSTQPETKFGDTAVAVNPSDERYKQYIGKTFTVDFVGLKREIKVVADRGVDKEFGTGALGVTPAHSLTDEAIARREKLPAIQVIDMRAKMTDDAGSEFVGLPVKKARVLLVEKLKAADLIEKEESLQHNVPICYRCGTTLEPQPSKQWFIAVDKPTKKLGGRTLKERALQVLEKNEIEFIPKRFSAEYRRWMENLHDWCISRQLWYGHRIPVWYRKEQGVRDKGQGKEWDLKIYGEDVFEALKNGSKTVELRAGRERGTGKYWGDFRPGDLITFQLADAVTDTVNENVHPVKKLVKTVRHYKSFSNYYKEYAAADDFPGKSEQELEEWWRKQPGMWERIEEYGLWAIELEPTYVMGFHQRTIEQVLSGRKTVTFRQRDHGLKIGDRFALENSQLGGVFGYGTISNVQTVPVRDVPLNDPAHGATYRNREELVAALKFHYPDKDTTIDSPIWIYTFSFEPLVDPEPEIYVGLMPPRGKEWVQDTDTLDTWFSSGLWTFSTLGWPSFAETATEGKPGPENDLANYHPTDVLETAYDIIFFWVARMILMSTYLVGEIPFKTVYLHGLVRDRSGRKMSKSLNNGIDPLEMTKKYGADAVRLSLVIGTTPGNDQKLSEEKIAGYRNYVNKIWNIGRFIALQEHNRPTELHVGRPERAEWSGASRRIPMPASRSFTPTPPSLLTLSDRWIASRLNRLVAETTAHLEHFEFSQAGEHIYDFAWHEFADWYLEITKVEGNVVLARETFATILKLLHPFMPFVTEELWQKLGYSNKLLIIAEWPAANKKLLDETAEKEFETIKTTINDNRKQRIEAKTPAGQPREVPRPKEKLLADHTPVIERLARVKFI